MFQLWMFVGTEKDLSELFIKKKKIPNVCGGAIGAVVWEEAANTETWGCFCSNVSLGLG